MDSPILGELSRRNKTLYWFGCFNVALLLMGFVMFLLDDTMILGINAWIKPMKFAISIAVYSWTFGWLLHYSPYTRSNRLITSGLVISMLVEVVLIYMQAFRGTTSHFNIHSAFDGMVFSVMGLFIGLNSLVNFYAILIFFRKGITITGPMLWAWRAGLVLFFLGGVSGGWMVGHLAHTVGAPDGGPGLPFVNWSTVAGDIRAAHFVTLHGLQMLPILTFWVKDRSQTWTVSVLALYILLCGYLHYIAYLGLPVIS